MKKFGTCLWVPVKFVIGGLVLTVLLPVVAVVLFPVTAIVALATAPTFGTVALIAAGLYYVAGYVAFYKIVKF